MIFKWRCIRVCFCVCVTNLSQKVLAAFCLLIILFFIPWQISSAFCFHPIKRSYLQFPDQRFPPLFSGDGRRTQPAATARDRNPLEQVFKSQIYFLPGFDSQGSYIGILLMRLEIRILSILNHLQLNCSQPPVFERVLVQRRLEDERGEEMQRLVKH